MITKCNSCKRPLNQPGDPRSLDCGGDCLQCMADAGDPDCIKSIDALNTERATVVLKKASDLTTADVVLHLGLRLAVCSVEPTHKDGLRVRLRKHEPINVKWDTLLWVEAKRCICARCAKYDGCPNEAPLPRQEIHGYEGICEDCREDRRHAGHTPEER